MPRERDQAMDRVGDRIGGRYRVEGELGRGGMATVYRVRDESTGDCLALKRFIASRAAEQSGELVFRREFHTLAQLRHPSIVAAQSFGIDERGPFYTMELLDGQDMRDRAPVEPLEACRLLRDVASALAFLHARRLLHRDVAPRNVRCTSDGRAKLIDFGVLGTLGVTNEVVGTPPCIAPEMLRFLPLDQRADLYGLGALAYWLLTGRHAYPARSVPELLGAWQKPPAPPTSHAPGVPSALSELVMSLLSSDPLARPADAADVIDRLGAIAGLEPSSELETERGYLVSAAMVGRHQEIANLRSRLARAVEGSGRAVVIEAPSGTGKSRLLREFALEVQLAGVTPLRVECESAMRGPYGVLRALTSELLLAAPEATIAAARRHAPVIARVLPELRARLGEFELAPLAGDPREERARVQTHLVEWLLDVALERPLAFLVDDMQRCDEGSAAALAALAHEAHRRPVLLTLALRTDETARAPSAVAAVRDAAVRIRLRGLQAEDVQELVRGLFGETPNLARLSNALHRMASGSPLLCTELLRHLVDRKVVRYVDGLWMVPEELHLEGLPSGLAEAMETRVRALGPAALKLGQILSLCGGETSLELCVELSEHADEKDVFAALDELVLHEVLVGTGKVYRFRHDGLKEAMLASLPADQKRATHRRIGLTLARAAPEGEREAEIGWHLLHGGEELEGAALLERAGRRLFENQSFSDSVAPLEAALEVFETRRLHPDRCLELRFFLVQAGFLCDRELTLRYAEDTIDALSVPAGIRRAERLAFVFGRHGAFVLSMLASFVRWRWPFTAREGKGLRPIVALRMYITAVLYTAGVFSVMLDRERLRVLLRRVEPLAVFKGNPTTYGTYQFVQSLYDYSLGRFGTVKRTSQTRLANLQDPKKTRHMREMEVKLADGGTRFVLALIHETDSSPETLVEIEAMQRLGMKVWDIGAMQLRMCWHLWRGEEEKAQAVRAETELKILQVGSSWQMEAWVPPHACLAYALSRNVIGLKRSIEDLARLTAEGYNYGSHLELSRAVYHRERGELDEALAAANRALELLPPGEGVNRPAAMAAKAETLLARAEYAEARAFAEEGYALASHPETAVFSDRMRCGQVMALADAALGDLDAAAERLDELITDAARVDNPVLSGMLHEARARVALMAKDRGLYELHRERMAEHFRSTRNPSLIARVDRLRDSGAAAAAAAGIADFGVDLAKDAVTLSAGPLHISRTARSVLSDCRGASERASRALELILQSSSAASGYLFAVRAGGLELVAPVYGEEPPDRMRRELERAVELATEEVVTIVQSVASPEPECTAAERSWQPLLIRASGRSRSNVIAAAVIVRGATSLSEPTSELLDAIGQSLYDAGDASSVFAVPAELAPPRA